MRQSVILLIAAAVGVLVGGWLVGRWALGCCVIFDSLCVGVWALGRDDGRGVAPAVHGVPSSFAEIIERARAS